MDYSIGELLFRLFIAGIFLVIADWLWTDKGQDEE